MRTFSALKKVQTLPKVISQKAGINMFMIQAK